MILFALMGNPAVTGRSEESGDGFSMQVISVVSVQRPQRRVYIYHTHTHEAYKQDPDDPYRPTETWRTADENYNMIRVGKELAILLQDAGVFVTHDTTDYELPRLSTAYSRSFAGIEQAAREGYDLYLDIHRDSYSKGNGPNTVTVDGEEAARLLFLIGQGTGSNLDEKPDWQANEKAALMIGAFLNEKTENLCRGVSLKSGRYNQQAATPSLLIEVGNNRNTLAEALGALPPLCAAICRYFDALAAP